MFGVARANTMNEEGIQSDAKRSSPTEIAEGLPLVLPVPEPADLNDRVNETTAMQVFFSWEILRLPYNAALVIVVLSQIGSIALDFVPHLIEAAILANIYFCMGPVAESYLCWWKVRRLVARLIVGIIGLIVATFYTVLVVDRIVNQMPVFPGFPNGLL
jgi:hypothetical protein